MPQAAAQRAAIPLSHAINKYFECSIYLLVLMGFGTLASTGTLDLFATLVVGAALALRGYLLVKGRSVVISERWTTPLTILYFVFYLGDFFLFSRSFLTATVHLVLFAVVVRSFSLRRDRDYTMLAILAFLMVLAIAICAHFVPKRWYDGGLRFFCAAPYYAQAGAMALLVVAVQYVAGSGTAPFIYSRF